MRALDSADAKSAMIWIIGEYGEKIENSIDLITTFADTFHEEGDMVQQAILTASVKIYLKMEGEAEDMIVEIL